MKKILFITHDASRSGAPLILLYLIQWIKENNPNYQLDIAFVMGGQLESKFKSITTNQFFLNKKSKPKGKMQRLFRKLIKKIINLPVNNIYKEISCNNYDIIYSNTVVSARHGNLIKQYNTSSKHIVHVHELQTIISTLAPDFNLIVPNIDFIIAASHQVKNNLLSNWCVKKPQVSVVYECAVVDMKKKPKTKNIFTVGACGLSYWRKGNDVFLQVARYVNKNYPDLNIEFLWVGNEYIDKPIIDADINKLCLTKKVVFIGETSNPTKYLNDFDVFLLPSREDPFPLVCIEVAHLKKPIICFEGASGTSELIEKGGGFVVPYLDIEAMGEKIVYYYFNNKQCIEDGEDAFELFKDFTPENICPQYFKIIERTLKS